MFLEPYQEESVEEEVELMRRFGHEVEIFDREQMQSEVASPLYRGGIWDKTNSAVARSRASSRTGCDGRRTGSACGFTSTPPPPG